MRNELRMRRIILSAIVGGLWLALLLGCNAPESVTRTETPPTPPTTSSPTPDPTTEIDRVLGVTARFKPVYKVLEVKDVSTATASRKVIHVSLPKGVEQAAIESNLRYAAKEAYEKGKPDALEVHGYIEGRTVDTTNVIGSLTFAPYGDWARAGEKPSLDKYRAVYEGRKTYLPPVEEEAPGTGRGLEKEALAGDYQAQRNLAYYLSTRAEGHAQNVVAACAWRIVILKSRHAEADSSDEGNKTFDCDRKLNSQQLREAESQANALLKRIKKR
jgi:hypothetical protein